MSDVVVRFSFDNGATTPTQIGGADLRFDWMAALNAQPDPFFSTGMDPIPTLTRTMEVASEGKVRAEAEEGQKKRAVKPAKPRK